MAKQKSTTTSPEGKSLQSSRTSHLDKWEQDYDSLLQPEDREKHKELLKLIGLELK